MEMKTTVQFFGDPAHYTVSIERDGIYRARLIDYAGPNIMAPPEEVILVRSVRKWSGSYGEQDFVTELGRAIDERNRELTDPAS